MMLGLYTQPLPKFLPLPTHILPAYPSREGYAAAGYPRHCRNTCQRQHLERRVPAQHAAQLLNQGGRGSAARAVKLEDPPIKAGESSISLVEGWLDP